MKKYLTEWRTHWDALAPREQTLAIAAAAVIALALLWWVLLAPALQTLRNSAAHHAELDAQLQHMQALQAEALQLKDAPRSQAGDGDALRTLNDSATRQLGAAAQLVAAGDRVTVTLKAVPAGSLAQWLTQARSAAHALPLEAKLTRSGDPAAARWDGTLVLALPTKPE